MYCAWGSPIANSNQHSPFLCPQLPAVGCRFAVMSPLTTSLPAGLYWHLKTDPVRPRSSTTRSRALILTSCCLMRCGLGENRAALSMGPDST